LDLVLSPSDAKIKSGSKLLVGDGDVDGGTKRREEELKIR
jgi:hypothetical protein